MIKKDENYKFIPMSQSGSLNRSDNKNHEVGQKEKITDVFHKNLGENYG